MDSMWGWGLARHSMFNVGSMTEYVIPKSVRDPMRDHGVQRGVQHSERDPEVRAGSNAGA